MPALVTTVSEAVADVEAEAVASGWGALYDSVGVGIFFDSQDGLDPPYEPDDYPGYTGWSDLGHGSFTYDPGSQAAALAGLQDDPQETAIGWDPPQEPPYYQDWEYLGPDTEVPGVTLYIFRMEPGWGVGAAGPEAGHADAMLTDWPSSPVVASRYSASITRADAADLLKPDLPRGFPRKR